MDIAPHIRAELFPSLTAEQLRRLEPYGDRQRFARGDLLFDEGDVNIDFFVVLSGSVDIRQYAGEEFELVSRPEAGHFIGDPSTLTGRAAVVQARVAEDSEILRVPTDRFRRVVVEDSELSDRFLRTFLLRRSHLIEHGHASLKVIGSRFSGDTNRLREFLTRNNQPFLFLDVEKDPGVAALLEAFGVGVERIAMVRHDVGDIRALVENDPRLLAQLA